ncbi:uncharacterized protein LOC119671240 [Teleopsis dalmanni]|uniref:uncharacterized protein LOC119671240 n=1 Tax=Teleopsis dalmanni TaxID=139649 RepID=UPI0018CE8EBC|nr:uncharacterized protein LOC119671240 [Teleopsis dalmanni]XP_037937708.1 uncharacterized protein LOC119671240 [Teleopsis dalmanni]
MESFLKGTSAKRFIIEDSITKVTSDGEPHEMMTMIAGLSGLAVAIVILAILASFVTCKKKEKEEECCEDCGPKTITAPITNLSPSNLPDPESQRSSINTICTRDSSGQDYSRPPSVSIISNGNLQGNMNSAFVGSELCLCDSLGKNKKTSQWADEVIQISGNKETVIDTRY